MRQHITTLIITLLLSLTGFAQNEQYVVFNLSPKYAVVTLNGEVLQTTDGLAAKRMPFGTYQYSVTAANYETAKGTITINNKDNAHNVTVKLKSLFSTYTFKVNNNAEIWINGEMKGKGSCNVDLVCGTYTVVCKLPNHRPTRQQITIIKNPTTYQINLHAPKPIYGSIDITSRPLGANILIDGKDYGITPKIINTFLIGKHQLQLKKEGYAVHQQNITVNENQTTPIDVTLPPIVREEVDDDRIFEVVEENAQFPGGEDSLYSWLKRNIRYPAIAQEQGIQGRVFVQFVVNKDGNIGDVKILSSPDPSLSREAERLVKSMPRWIPARLGEKNVRSRFNLPIMFRLRGDDDDKKTESN